VIPRVRTTQYAREGARQESGEGKAMRNRTWLQNSRGEWFVPGQAALTLAVLAAPRLDGGTLDWSGLVGALGIVLCIVGLGVVLLGSLALGRNLSPFPKPKVDGRLVTNGIFAVVRHPIYGGFSVAAVGWSFMWNGAATYLATALLLVFFDIKARHEERWLQARFADYAAYKSRVKKLVPFVY
jgi:protein-S-isoprenylcysteine O-methyltransferase Ste14